mmetsp:Transcript_22177/g.47705  ORF Transcript_22177/g.47705 Transcript_22177/m.47705 type:complete len:118 (-) Transcript_22177:59-412(-)
MRDVHREIEREEGEGVREQGASWKMHHSDVVKRWDECGNFVSMLVLRHNGYVTNSEWKMGYNGIYQFLMVTAWFGQSYGMGRCDWSSCHAASCINSLWVRWIDCSQSPYGKSPVYMR